MFETNSSFRVKQRTIGKSSIFIFQEIFAIGDKAFISGGAISPRQ